MQQICQRITAHALLTTFTVCATCSVDTQLETSILNEFVQRWRQIKESDGFAQRLLICSSEHRATKKALLAGYLTFKPGLTLAHCFFHTSMSLLQFSTPQSQQKKNPLSWQNDTHKIVLTTKYGGYVYFSSYNHIIESVLQSRTASQWQPESTSILWTSP